MRSRIFFAVIVAFWLAMNYLLWRSQSACHTGIGSAIPVEVVWEKILTAPDDSPLDIYDHDIKIGRADWRVALGKTTQALNQTLAEDYEPDGSIPKPSGYELTFDGNSSVLTTNHLTFRVSLMLSTNHTWQDFHTSGKMGVVSWDVHAIAALQNIMAKINGDDGVWQKTIKFSDLDHPESILAEYGGLEGLGVPAVMAGPLGKISLTQAASSLQWEAHEDWMQFGHSRVRVYRLETQFLGQHLYIFTSRVGEILWVEAPNKLTLRNGFFGHF